MRVALVVHEFPSREHPYIFDWVAALIAQGVNLTVVTEKLSALPNSGFWSSRKTIERHVRQINLVGSPNFWLFLRSLLIIPFRPYQLWRLFRELEKEEGRISRTVYRKLFEYLPLLGERFDIVHFNAPQIAVRRFELKSIFRARSLVSFRGQDFTFHPDRYDHLLQKADHLHFISEFLVRQAIERGYDGMCHTLIYPMVDTEFYSPTLKAASGDENPHRAWTLFSAARLEWVKGWDFALQAVALLLERGWDVDYYIAGEGELRDMVLYTIDQLGIGEHVYLLGWQSPEQVRDWMRKADIYLLASVEEGFNNSVLQAQACGLPVVCSDEGGLPENIEDRVTGLLFQRRDAWDMVEKVELLLSRGYASKQMGKKARKRVSNRFDISNKKEEFLKLYSSLLK